MIGDTTSITVEVNVSNTEQPAFEVNIIFTVNQPFDIIHPNYEDCERTKNDTFVTVICPIFYPLTNNIDVSVQYFSSLIISRL